jgi:dihydrolipoamide dehydrogenase
MPDPFDLVVIGAGPGGYVAAIRAAQLGKKVAVVEKRTPQALGGTCLNVGCIPSKALLDSSEYFHLAAHKLTRHGIKVEGVSLDLAAMMKRKDAVVKSLTDGVGFLFKKNKISSFFGAGKLLGPGKVEVDEGGKKTVLEGTYVLLATGSESTPLPGVQVDGKVVVTSTEALTFETVPKRLVVIGAGIIGLELGSVWARLGSKVTVVEFLPRILPTCDGEVAAAMQKLLAKQGFEFHLSRKVTGLERTGDQARLIAEDADGRAHAYEGDKVLVAVGRRPYTEGLGLKEAGVAVDTRTGRVTVDERFETNVKGVYAIGDLIDGPMFAHKASEDGLAVAEMLAGHVPHVDYNLVPSAVYTWPEIAQVGKTEEQVKETAGEYRVGKFPFAASGRAKAMDETDGFVKIITDAKTDKLLGVHILGARASDLIAEAVAVMAYGGSAEDLARCVHGHPSLSESVMEAARAAWLGMALHS